MHDLVPASGSLTQAVAAAKSFIAFSKAAATVRAYASAWRIFADWCAGHGLDSLPAMPETVTSYLAWLAQSRKVSTVEKHAAAIGDRHKLAGLPPPTSHPLVKSTLSGIARLQHTAPHKKSALTAELLIRLLRAIPDDLEGKRDRALILTGFAAALRRSELVDLNVNDVARHPKGLVLTIRKSKTDQAGAGIIKAIPHGRRLKVISALDDWLITARITGGAVFRALDHGAVTERRLGDKQVARIVQKRCLAIGLDASLFAGHSLRSGYITTAADHGADLHKIKTHAGHAKADTTLGYMQTADAFKDHSGSGFL